MEAINLTMPQLVSAWNNMVARAHQLGLTTFKPLNSKFKTLEVGAARLEKLESAIRAREASERAVAKEVVEVVAPEAVAEAVAPEAVAPVTEEDEMAKRKAKTKTKAKRAPKQSLANGTSIKAKTQSFNDLVPQAKRLGITWARHHTSDFGSHQDADKMTKRLKSEMAAASR